MNLRYSAASLSLVDIWFNDTIHVVMAAVSIFSYRPSASKVLAKKFLRRHVRGESSRES